MVNIAKEFQSRRQLRAVLPSVLALMLGVCTPTTFAGAALPPSNSDAKAIPGISPQVAKLLQDSDNALKSGNLNLALILLKNAVRLAPQTGEVRAQLGVVLLRTGEALAAERELRQARNDNASDEVVVPAILQAMLVRNEIKDLLAEFPDPPEATQDKTAADILKARAVALQLLGQPAQARTAMDRALRLKRDVPFLIAGAKLAQQQGDLALARRLTDEARKLAPTSEEALIVTTYLLRQAGERENALTALDDFVKSVPESILAKILRIEVLLELKQDAKAKEQVDVLLKTGSQLLIWPVFSRRVAGTRK